MKKIIHQKVHFGFALLVIVTSSVIPIVLFVSVMLQNPTAAQAIVGTDTGIEVLPKGPVKCVLNNIDGDCLASCPICGDLADCNGMWEVPARALNPSATSALYKGSALCLAPTDIIPPKGGRFFTKGRCLGKVTPGKIQKLFNFGCYRF